MGKTGELNRFLKEYCLGPAIEIVYRRCVACIIRTYGGMQASRSDPCSHCAAARSGTYRNDLGFPHRCQCG